MLHPGRRPKARFPPVPPDSDSPRPAPRFVDPYAHAPRLPDEGSLDLRAVFHGPRAPGPVELEIGPGRGWFTVERLELDPGAYVVGLEIKRKWATIVDERLKKRGLGGRGRVFAEDARLIVPRLVQESLARVYLHFPDPWWKKRHQKRLVLGAPLLDGLVRALAPEGEFFVQTDVLERAERYESEIDAHGGFRPVQATARIEDHSYGARSPRERIAIRDGIPVYRLLYQKR